MTAYDDGGAYGTNAYGNTTHAALLTESSSEGQKNTTYDTPSAYDTKPSAYGAYSAKSRKAYNRSIKKISAGMNSYKQFAHAPFTPTASNASHSSQAKPDEPPTCWTWFFRMSLILVCCFGSSVGIAFAGYAAIVEANSIMDHANSFNHMGTCIFTDEWDTVSCEGKNCVKHHYKYEVHELDLCDEHGRGNKVYRYSEEYHDLYDVGDIVTCYADDKCNDVLLNRRGSEYHTYAWVVYSAAVVLFCCSACCCCWFTYSVKLMCTCQEDGEKETYTVTK